MLLIWMSKNSLQYFKQEGATGNTADPWHFWDVQFVEMFLFSSTNIVWKDEISNEIYVLCLADKTCFFVSPFSLSLSLSLSLLQICFLFLCPLPFFSLSFKYYSFLSFPYFFLLSLLSPFISPLCCHLLAHNSCSLPKQRKILPVYYKLNQKYSNYPNTWLVRYSNG